MSSLQPLGLAVWGLGNHAWKSILPAISTSNLVKLIGVCTRDIAKAKQAGQIFGGKIWLSPQEMLSEQAVDAVYLATPTGLHFEQGGLILKANKHLLCEKSLTNNSKESLRLVNYARANNLVLFEAFMYLYHPQFLTVLNIIKQPSFGKVLSIVSNFGFPELSAPGFRISKDLGGSAFWDVGCYPISAVLAINRELPKILQFKLTHSKNYNIDVSGAVTLGFSNGSNAFLSWGYDRAYKADLMMWGEQQSIYTERIFSKAHDYTAKIFLNDKYGKSSSITITPANSFVEMFKDFSLAIANQSKREKLLETVSLQAQAMGLLEQALTKDGFF